MFSKGMKSSDMPGVVHINKSPEPLFRQTMQRMSMEVAMSEKTESYADYNAAFSETVDPVGGASFPLRDTQYPSVPFKC